MKYEIKFTTQFKHDLKLAKKQNKDLDELFDVVDILVLANLYIACSKSFSHFHRREGGILS